ncbi:MAG: selenide, water dikinase [Candidatus Binatia bacterium]|nr:MAG: selenide, water dikinase [Candidatus Binatia bacterium]
MDPSTGPLDDAALLRPPAGPSLVFTVDFITPVVDGPEDFGAIAAANALSDVYAMGGEPRAALAVCGFPQDKLPVSILERILRGGQEKAAEAGCAIVGGHTIADPELKYGLCVLGIVDPERALVHTRARAGDLLVLTKPLGFGVAAQALKAGELPPPEVAQLTELMKTLNKDARDAALAAGAHAATDVTGFGLLGHLRHLLLGAGLAARLRASSVPVLDFARDLARRGLVPGGTKANARYVAAACRWDAGVDETLGTLLVDAQTSGGLLVTVPPGRTDALLEELERRGVPARSVVGELCEGEPGSMDIRP